MAQQGIEAGDLMRMIVIAMWLCAVAACPVPASDDLDDDLCPDCDGICDEFSGVCGKNDCDVVGEACGDGGFCAGGRCERTCEAPVARGEVCREQSDEGGSCDFAATCADGLICSVNTGGEAFFGDCVPPTNRAVGERCGDDTASCGAGLVCSVDERCVVDDG